jgi:hypothetical protein
MRHSEALITIKPTHTEENFMGTWSSPNTVKNAKELSTLMASPLLKKDAAKLYPLMGDDRLFDAIDDDACDPLDDIRFSVASRLKDFLEALDTFFIPWDEEAINICKKIVSKYY